MPVVESLIRSEADGTISFGNYQLAAKSKLQDFEHDGDSYKIKTYYEITKLERNGMFAYSSVPGTSVLNFSETADSVSFIAEGAEDAQITLELKEDTEYEVWIDGKSIGTMKTNLGGKLNISVELEENKEVGIKVTR